MLTLVIASEDLDQTKLGKIDAQTQPLLWEDVASMEMHEVRTKLAQQPTVQGSETLR